MNEEERFEDGEKVFQATAKGEKKDVSLFVKC